MTDFTHVEDSGERRQWATGSQRDTRVGKGRFDLIPPIALREIAVHFEHGSVKYGDRNWEKGQPLSAYIDSAMRHMCDLMEGKCDENHAAAAAWNVMALIHTREMIRRGHLPQELDDMPPPLD